MAAEGIAETSAEAVTDTVTDNDTVTVIDTVELDVYEAIPGSSEAGGENYSGQGRSKSGRRTSKKGRRKRIILLCLIFVMVAVITAELVMLMTMTSVDSRFIRSVERGVAAGWETGSSELQLKYRGKITDASFIDAELEAVEEFRYKPYQSDELKELAAEYIDALKKCHDAAAAHDPASDNEAFWEEFSEPYGQRVSALRKLYMGDYKLGTGWDDYAEKRDEMLFRGWLVDKASQIVFEKTGTKSGITGYKYPFVNDSGFDIEYINFDVELYDSKGKVIGIAEVVKENIRNGRQVNIGFYYTGNKLKEYRITGVDAIAKAKDYSREEKTAAVFTKAL